MEQDDVKNKNLPVDNANAAEGGQTCNSNPAADMTSAKNVNMGTTADVGVSSEASSSSGAAAVSPMAKIYASFGIEHKDPFPKVNGLNSLGFFNYTHYGHLNTKVEPESEFLTRPTPAVAIDCEMVGVGPLKEDALARVSIVNEFGYCLYDKFVKPKLEVTDYRTEFSGVREEDLKNAEDFTLVIQNVANIIKGKFLIGHSLQNDFDVLLLNHPKAKIRDTSYFYKKKYKDLKTPSLKSLVRNHLKVVIQAGEHNSITDAQAAMKLYLIKRDEWENACGDRFNYRVNRYWMTHEFRKAFQSIGFTININVKTKNSRHSGSK